MEKDVNIAADGAINAGFQSTLSHGERPKQLNRILFVSNFNPLSRMEKDFISHNPYVAPLYFNPLSRMEKDIISPVLNFVFIISIHSLAWRKTMG